MPGADTQVDFYHLQSDSARKLQLFGCRLIDKAWQLGHTIFVLVDDEQQASQLDELLWTWRDDSFLPHSIYRPENGEPAAVNILTELPEGLESDLLVNLSSRIPPALESGRSGFSRIAEIIDQNPTTKQHGRIRYSYYDKCNVTLKYHEITAG